MRNITNKTFLILLVVLNLLNIFDAIVTSLWVEYFGAVELNPFMNWLLSLGYPAFITIKTLSMFLLSYLFWDRRNKQFTNLALYLGLVIYGTIAVYEIGVSLILLSC